MDRCSDEVQRAEKPEGASGLLQAKRWLTAYTAYYNHHRSHQALENQTPIEALELEGSI